MKDSRILKLIIVLISTFLILGIIKQNVTATKEIPVDNKQSSGALNLEINSQLVQNAYATLILLKDRNIDDEIYRYSYFNITDKNELTQEEKLYVAFENIYKNGGFEKETSDEVEILKVSEEIVKNEIFRIFKDDSFAPVDINYKSSMNCGIIDFLYTGNSYELKYKKCDEKNKGFDVSKLVSAVKDGNFIKLTVKSVYAIKHNKKDEYMVKNYNTKESLAEVSLDEINEELLDEVDAKSYIFSFELKGDDYYLVNVKEE